MRADRGNHQIDSARYGEYPMPEPRRGANVSDQDRMEALEARLQAAKQQAEAEEPRSDEHYSMANVAWRMVIELVAGLGIGFLIGMGLDRLFGTMPFFLIIFILFGLAAGINVMMRTAKEVQEKQVAHDAEVAKKETPDG